MSAVVTINKPEYDISIEGSKYDDVRRFIRFYKNGVCDYVLSCEIEDVHLVLVEISFAEPKLASSIRHYVISATKAEADEISTYVIEQLFSNLLKVDIDKRLIYVEVKNGDTGVYDRFYGDCVMDVVIGFLKNSKCHNRWVFCERGDAIEQCPAAKNVREIERIRYFT